MMLVLPTMPATFSVSTSFLAAAAACAGSVCSVSWTSSTGRPLMPPLSLTHLKYASAVLAISVKSVPGCLVLIAPSLIGSPEAGFPLPRPHLEAFSLPVSPAKPLSSPPPPPPLLSSSSPQAATKSANPTASAANMTI